MVETLFFDLETQRSFDEVGGRYNINRMGLSVAVTYSDLAQAYHDYFEPDVEALVADLSRADLVVGFNVLRFDYEVLRGYTDFDLSQIPTVDMLQDLYAKLGFRVSLDSVAQATLGTSKSADGLQALAWYREGRMDEIVKYCRQDVNVTRQVYAFGKAKGYVSFKDRYRGVRRVRVDW